MPEERKIAKKCLKVSFLTGNYEHKATRFPSCPFDRSRVLEFSPSESQKFNTFLNLSKREKRTWMRPDITVKMKDATFQAFQPKLNLIFTSVFLETFPENRTFQK